MKRKVLYLLLFVSISLSACLLSEDAPEYDAIPAGPASTLRDFTLPAPLFAAESAWRQAVVGVAVLPTNDVQILTTYRVLLGDTTDLHPAGPAWTDWPFMYVNYADYSIPIAAPAGGVTQSVTLCDYAGDRAWPGPKFPDAPQQEGGPVTVPAPAGMVRPSGPADTDADGHLVLYNPATFMAYDFWQATTARRGECRSLGGGQTGSTLYEAGAVDYFDVRNTGVNLDGVSSARAVGTSLLAGLLLPEDVASGVISHALAFAIPGLRNLSDNPETVLISDYVYPASTTETDYYNTNANALVAGQRVRLKAALVDDEGLVLDESTLTPITQLWLAALRTYGAYLVDSSGGFTFYAEDIHTGVLNLTDDEVNALIGQAAGTLLPSDKTQWQVVLERLNLDLERIPFAYGPEAADPAQATIITANFEVVEGAPRLAFTSYLPITMAQHSEAEPLALNAMMTWGYQIQALNVPGAVDVLAASAYDMLVLEPTRTDWSSDDKYFDAPGMVSRLKNTFAADGLHRKLLIAYIDIGEAEDWRWYWTWSQAWDCTGQPPADWPDYIIACDPDGWSGNYPVAYWDAAWKDIVIYGHNTGDHPDRDYVSLLDEVLKDGFDGIYLDWVEAFEDESVMAAAQAAGKDPAAEMLAFIQEMRTYATARNPNFVIIQQNATALIDGQLALTSAIDAIAQEAIWYDGDADVDWGNANGYDHVNAQSLVDYYLGYLDDYLLVGLPVFDCEYAVTYASTAYSNAYAAGFVPYVTQRALSQLTTTPPTPPTATTPNDFLYQLQNLDLTAVGATAYDWVVMDYAADGDDATAFTSADVSTLKASPGGDKFVLAYMSIGEAEDYRFYWDAAWDANGDGTPDAGAPAWLDIENPNWEGNYKVQYWDADWQSIVFSYTDRLLNAGFDGAYLDIIDAYEYYAEQGRTTAAQEMADFIAALRAYAQARDADFYIMPQNAAELATLIPTYLNSVDGIGQEDIYYGYDADDTLTPPAVTTEVEGYLDVFLNAGKLVLTVDYATTLSHIDDAYAKSQAKGYVPFVTGRDLDALTLNPGHEPD